MVVVLLHFASTLVLTGQTQTSEILIGHTVIRGMAGVQLS